MIKLLIPLLLLAGCGKPITETKATQNTETNPYMGGVSENMLFDIKMSLNFNLLPLKGKVLNKERLWSGDAWAFNKGSINHRWNAAEKTGFDYKSPSSREVIAYPTDRLKELSPSEKYDIYMGRYDYPLKMEVDWMARAGKMDWEGLCHGWAGASLNHSEPAPVTVTNPDGIVVHFGSADVKALLTYAYSKINIRQEDSLGKRCEYYSLIEEDFCDDDLSALTFHAVLTNKLGLYGQSFIADMDRYKEVWNHPILSYESKIDKRERNKVSVTTKVTYVDITEKNDWEKGAKQMVSYLTVKYELDLDANGNMINGRWLTRERPDFLWTVSEPQEFDGYLSSIRSLIK